MSDIKEHTYYIKGMHCASCEILIEKTLIKFDNVDSVDVSLADRTALVEYEKELPNIGKINAIFEKYGYTFYNHPPKKDTPGKSRFDLTTLAVAILFAAFFFFVLPKTGLSTLAGVNSKSSLPAFLFFGILAGISSCAALVGGIVLSMSKQWAEIHRGQNSFAKKFEPHLLFNVGRLISYIFFGGVLGLVGSGLKISPTFSSFLVIAVSLMMVMLGLQMIGVKGLQKFQIAAPKFLTRYIANEKNFVGRYMPSILGALTFFLPCGFTITAQSLALLSGNAVQGGLIMFFFALGTMPVLLAIGLSSVKFLSRPETAGRFLKVAGALVLVFAIFNINSQLNVLGVKSFNDIVTKPEQTQAQNAIDNLASLQGGKQILKMNASSSGYSPNYFKVEAGVPVRWEITDTGTSGCTNAVISKGLFPDQIDLTNGQTSVKEFTPEKAGKYKFSCWMGMVSGVIEVVPSGTSTAATPNNSIGTLAVQTDPSGAIPSGAKGCGCGGGGSGACGAKQN